MIGSITIFMLATLGFLVSALIFHIGMDPSFGSMIYQNLKSFWHKLLGHKDRFFTNEWDEKYFIVKETVAGAEILSKNGHLYKFTWVELEEKFGHQGNILENRLGEEARRELQIGNRNYNH